MTKLKTVGVDPKVPVQAVATVVVALVAYFGVDLDAEAAGAVAAVIGIIAGILAPAPKTVAVPS